MAKKVKFKLNREGVRELLQSDEMAKICEEYAEAALSRLDEGYSMNTHKGRNRVNVEVKADSIKAKRQTLKHNSILKAVQG